MNSSIESVDIIENSDVETPVKSLRKQRNSASSDNSIHLSTKCLSRSSEFLRSPDLTPKIIAIESESSALVSNDKVLPISTESEFDGVPPATFLPHNPHLTFLNSGSDNKSAASNDRSPASTDAFINSTYLPFSNTGAEDESAPPADCFPEFTDSIMNGAQLPLLVSGSENKNLQSVDRSPASVDSVMESSHLLLPTTRPENESSLSADRSPAPAEPAMKNTHLPLSNTSPEDKSGPSTNPLPASADSEMENTHLTLLTPGPENKNASADRSQVSANAVIKDNLLPNLNSSLEDKSEPPVDSSPAFEDPVMENTHLPLPTNEHENESVPSDDRSPTSTDAAITIIVSADGSAADRLPNSVQPVEEDVVFTTFLDCNRLTNSQKRRKRRKATKAFRKSYMDFQSDDEQQDFSGGSSDVWECSDISLSSDDEQGQKQKKNQKKKKKEKTIDSMVDANNTIKKKQKPSNTYKINKQLKNEGKQYVTRKGKVIEAKSMKENPCIPGKCKRSCYEISEERRRSIFKFYWGLDIQRRRDWLVRCARVDAVRRKRVIDSNRRQLTVDYYINDNEDHKKVCQKFLLNTLDITQRHLNYIVTNALEGMSQKDVRTRHAPDKYTESTKANVRKFIESLPACPSHYNRKNSKRMYLPQDFRNLSNLYRIYQNSCKKNEEDIISETLFRKIFNEEYDLGFHSPKKDKCVLCTKAENTETDMTEEDKEKLKKHIEEKEASYKRFKAHQTLKEVKTVCCSFDLQKVLNTPYGESMLLYYARKYAVFNFTVYESVAQNVYCYTWGECDGKRGSNEIASCLYLYLKELDKRGVETVLLYCDSCTGQNKNRVILSMLNYFLLKSENLQVIQVNYLLPGHTYMPADSVHATIESEVKKIIVWSPTQWPSYFETARKKPKPYNVEVMDHTDFINWEQLATKTFSKETSKNVKFKNIRIATFKKRNLNTMEIKYSMKEDAVREKVTLFKKTSIKGKGKGKGKGKSRKPEEINQEEESNYLQELNNIKLQPCYAEKLAISALKYKDLKKLCLEGTIPKRFHKDYLEMLYCGNKNDSLIETDEEDVESVE